MKINHGVMVGVLLRGLQIAGGFLVLSLLSHISSSEQLKIYLYITSISQILSFFDFGVGTSFVNKVIDSNSIDSKERNSNALKVYLDFRLSFTLVAFVLSVISIILIYITSSLNIEVSLKSTLTLFCFFFVSTFTQLSLKIFVGLGELIRLQILSAIGTVVQVFAIILIEVSNSPKILFLFSFILPSIIAHQYVFIVYLRGRIKQRFQIRPRIGILNLHVTIFQLIQLISGLAIPYVVINSTTTDLYNTFQTLSKIFLAFVGAFGVMLPKFRREERLNMGSIKWKNDLILTIAPIWLMSIGIALVIVWKRIFPTLVTPGFFQVFLWVVISVITLQNMAFHFKALGIQNYNLLIAANLGSTVALFTVWFIVKEMQEPMKGEFILLFVYGIYNIIFRILRKNKNNS